MTSRQKAQVTTMNHILAASALAMAHTFSHGAPVARPVDHRAEVRYEMRAQERAQARPVYTAPVYAQPVNARPVNVRRFDRDARPGFRAEHLPSARVQFHTHRGPRW
jgi:hypothetical protein